MNLSYPGKRSIVFFCLALLFPFFKLNAQQHAIQDHSLYIIVYKLTTEEAEEIYKKEQPSAKVDKYLHTPFDTIAYKDKDTEVLPEGHYLYSMVKENEVYYFLYSFGDLEILVQNDNNDLAFSLYSKTTGDTITTAEAWIGRQKINYDPVAHCYRLKNHKEQGTLKVKYKDASLFYFISYANGRRLSGRPKKYRRMLRSFIFPYYKGYIMFNKPVYQPGDTVKLKALLLKNGTKPLDKKLRLKIEEYSNYSYKSVLTDTVTAAEKGVYLYEFVVNERFKVDVHYEVYLKALKKDETLQRSHFKTEDYQLDEISYKVSLNKTTFNCLDSIQIQLSAKDKNNLYVPDAIAEITVKPFYIEEFYEDSLYVPFEIYHQEHSLEFTRDTKFFLPDSIFPKIKARYEMSVRFNNSNNETKDTILFFTVDKETNFLTANFEKGNLHVEAYHNKVPVRTEATLYSICNRDTLEIKKIRLPASLPPHPLATRYMVKHPEAATILLESEKARSLVSYRHAIAPDSVWFQFVNPCQVEICYKIFLGKKLVKEGSASQLEWKTKKTVKDEYSLVFNYNWAGSNVKETVCLYPDKHWLNVRVRQPGTIAPGTKQETIIQVSDYKDKPVKNADLTASAINSQFKEKRIPALYYPGHISYKGKYIANYAKKNITTYGQKKEIENVNEKKFQLDSLLYYQISRPVTGLNSYYEKLENEPAQFSPLVFKEGEEQKVYLIELDGHLIYFSGLKGDYMKSSAVYSFIATEGFHKVRLRTFSKDILIDSVYIKAKNRLILSVDEEIPHPLVKKKKCRARLSKADYTNIQRSAVYIKNDSKHMLYVGKEYNLLPFGTNYYPMLAGPVDSDSILIYLYKHHFHQFPIQPGHSYYYTIGNLKDSIFKYYKPALKRKFSKTFPVNFLHKDPWPLALTRENIFPEEQPKPEIIFWKNPENTSKDYGSLFLELPDSIRGIYLENNSNHFVFAHKNIVLYNIAPGHYSVTLLDKNKNLYRIDSVVIYANTIFLRKNNTSSESVSENDVTHRFSIYKLYPYSDQYYTKRMLYPTGNEDDKTTRYSYSSASADRPYSYNRPYYDTENNYHYRRFNSKYRYYAIGASIKGNWLHSNYPSSLAQVREGLGVELKRRFSARISLHTELSYFRLYGADQDQKFRSTAFAGSLYATYDLVRSYARYQKRPDFVPFIQTGVMLLWHHAAIDSTGSWQTVNAGNTPHYTPFQIAFPTGVGVRYKLSRQLDLGLSYTYAFTFTDYLEGAKGTTGIMGKDAFSSVNVRMHYIIPSRVVCPKFRSDEGPRRNYDAAETFSSYGNYNKTLYEIENRKGMIYSMDAVQGVVVMSKNKKHEKRYYTPRLEYTDKNQEESDALFEEDIVDAATEEPSGVRSSFADYAYWQPLLKTDENGIARFKTKFPDNITSWDSYAIAVLSRKKQSGTGYTNTQSYKNILATLSTPRFLVEGDQTEVIGKIVNYSSDSLLAQIDFSSGQDSISSEEKIAQSKITPYVLTAPYGDSLTMSFALGLGNGYRDGEKRTVPIIKKGIEETEGIFLVLDHDTALSIPLAAGKEHSLYIQNNALEVMLEEINYLKDYPHLCMEQTASKLIGFLMEKKIDAVLNKPFHHEREIHRMIRRLEKGQNDDGSWGWWPNTETNLTMSVHVMKALALAFENGYSIRCLDKANAYATRTSKENATLSLLITMKELGIDADYSSLLDSVVNRATYIHRSDYNWMEHMRLKQLLGKPVDYARLMSKGKQTYLGGLYWGDHLNTISNNTTTETLLSYSILKEGDGREKELKAIRNYFMEARRTGHWRNTYESALILYTILPDLLKNTSGYSSPELALEGAIQQKPLSLPFFTKTNNSGALTIRYKGSTPVYITTYSKFWNTSPQAVTKDFVVESTFLKEEKTVLQKLKPGAPVTMDVKVTAIKRGEYIMVEIPIPAGCSYGEHVQGLYPEVHREYYKDKVCIYLESINPGTYHFAVPLEPRFKGSYTLNPAKVELMYFPTFYGRNDLRKVEVR